LLVSCPIRLFLIDVTPPTRLHQQQKQKTLTLRISFFEKQKLIQQQKVRKGEE